MQDTVDQAHSAVPRTLADSPTGLLGEADMAVVLALGRRIRAPPGG